MSPERNRTYAPASLLTDAAYRRRCQEAIAVAAFEVTQMEAPGPADIAFLRATERNRRDYAESLGAILIGDQTVVSHATEGVPPDEWEAEVFEVAARRLRDLMWGVDAAQGKGASRQANLMVPAQMRGGGR